MFSSAHVSIRDAKFVSLPWLVNVSTVNDFDHQLLNYVNSSSFWNMELGCKSSSSIHNRARYAVSLTCATIIFSPKSTSLCNPENNTVIPLCQSTCESYSKSIQSIVSSAKSDAICNLSGGNLITAGVNSLSQQCSTNDALKGIPSTGCISGADNELDMCGFGQDLDTLCHYCNDYDSTLSCCKEYNCLKNKEMLMTGGAIAGIVVGVTSGLCICGFIGFCMIRKSQKKQSTHPGGSMYNIKKELERMPPSNSTLMMSTPEQHMMKHVYPIEDEDYMELVPDINIGCDLEAVKGHVFKVNSLDKQFVRVIYQLNAPENPDELELIKGDIIRMYYYFDDGWAFGDNFGSGLRGLFPILCVVNLTAEEVQELIYLSELPEGDEEESGEYYSSIRHFSTGVEYGLDPKGTIRLQNLRRTVTYREKQQQATKGENNFQYLCAASSSISPLSHNLMMNAGDPSVPPQRTASMHATFGPRRLGYSNGLQDPLRLMQEEHYSESSGSTAIANNTPDSKSYLNGF
ncbi:uncharacterized protein EV154DRAFT_568021 [Mucor mucedo]|uniref:uncharacterized protein n=1 Tax=Mucor mucedo TaxID=29922 RepID=UPI00221E4959|nr:uncharacterized protein EV154DRAFT_568021 [Mucor mucedo]KAI7883829.1 hypothetical protein EV154DRAFT_568021 [Mucor mucedo]